MTVSDELIKLKELLDSEVITKSEFAELKERALRSSKSELNDTTNLEHTKEEPMSEVKPFNKSHCASCGKKINFANRYQLKDKSYICGDCLKNAGFNFGAEDLTYLKTTVTLPSLLDDHSAHTQNTKLDSHAIKCPKCKSTNVQFMQQGKKAFSIGKAVGGAVLTGGIGTLAGFAGKKGKKQWFCQNCNSTFETKK